MTDKIRSNLNKDQYRAVTHNKGSLLVLAGAGSGKTRVLTHRVAWLINEKKVNSKSILLLTFTNKAADEMKERVIKLTEEKPAFAGTFHSFCVQVLRREGTAIGIDNIFVIYDEQDSKDVVRTILNDLDLPTDTYNPKAIINVISEAKSQMLNPNMYAELANNEWQEKVFKVYLEYERYLRKAQALDFDDLLLKTVELFETKPEILNKWQRIISYVLVDEWQDTNKIQYKLTKQIVGDRNNLTAVGDASQSIYSWRGADYRNINYLTRDFPDIEVVNLEQNYRSTQNILTSANSVITKNSSHPILNLWTKKGKGESIKVYRARSGLDEANFLVNQIKTLTLKKYKLSDVAILYRTNAQSRVIEEAFLHAGVPYVLVRGVRFYSRKEIKDVLSYLRLLVNPKDTVSQKRIEKIGKRRFDNFKKFTKEVGNLKNYTTLELLDSVLRTTKYQEKYGNESEENLMRLENIKELRSVATEFPIVNEFLENVALVEAEQTSKGALKKIGKTSKGKITLMTMHAAKGLEYKIIFIVGMEEGLFPHSRSLFDINQLEEERRLAYVGMTRAKELLYLSFASKRLYFGQRTSNPPSRFIIDIPEDILEAVESIND